MATAGSIVIDLLMKTGSFETDTKRAAQRLKEFEKAAKQVGAVVGGALVTGATALAAAIRTTISEMEEVGRLAQVAGSSVEQFTRMSYGAELAGVSAEKLADIYKDVGDKVGDFLQTGGGALADFFENIAPKVGVTAAQFRKLSGPDALGLYFSSLEKAKLSQSELTFYMEAIASDATMLIPLLRNNSAEFKRLGDEAAALGLVLTADVQEGAAEVERNFRQMQKVQEGIVTQVTVNMLPTFSTLSKLLVDVAKDGDLLKTTADALATALKGLVSGGIIVGTVFDVVAESIASVVSGLTLLAQGQVKAAAAALSMGGRNMVDSVKKAAEAISTIWTEQEKKSAGARSAVLGGGGAGGVGGGKPAKQSQAEKYLESLKKQLQTTQDLSVAETVLADIQAGRLGKVTKAQQEELIGVARQIDAARALAEQQKTAATFEEQLRDARLQAVSQQESNNAQLAESNRQLSDEIELIGLSEEAQRAVIRTRESSTIALKEEQLARLQNEAYMSREAIALEEEIRLLRERQELNDRKSTAIIREQDIEKAKEFTKGLETDLKSAFQAAFNDSENPAQAFVKSLASVLYNRVSSALATALFDALAGSGGGGGGLLGSLLQTGLSFLGGGSSPGLSFGSSSLSLGGSSLGLKLPGRAAGGPVAAGQAYIVGERRPELFIPHTSGQILPSVPGLGSMKVVVNNNAPVEVTARGMSDGEILLEIDQRIAGQVPGIMASQARSPSTQFGRQLSRSWNVESKRGG